MARGFIILCVRFNKITMVIYKIAIVEDDEKQYEVVSSLLKEYETLNDVSFSVSYFHNGLEFLKKCKESSFDLIFMDIEMPELDGLSVSKELRLFDKEVPIIIISYSAKYAVKGYYINAFGYLVKPILKTDFNFLLKKVITEINRKKNSYILLEKKSSIQKVFTKDILYIEVENHYLHFYLTSGNDIVMRGKMGDYVKLLNNEGFARCNECYLVNLAYVTKIDSSSNSVIIGNISLALSKQKKKSFIEVLTNYLGENAQNV